MPSPLPEKPAVRKRRRQRTHWLITGAVLTVLAIVAGAVLLTPGPSRPLGAPAEETREPDPAPAVPETNAARDTAVQPDGPELVEDDGRTLWVSPTRGAPIALDYLPPGVQLLLHVRPAELLATDDGPRSLEALGPSGAALVEELERVAGVELAGIESLLAAVRGAPGRRLDVTLVVTPATPLGTDGDAPEPPRAARLAREAQHNGASYWDAGAWCYFAPPRDEGKRFVVAGRETLHEVLEARGAPPPLRRELETLAAMSDRQRHLSLLVAPSFLFTEGEGLWAGVAAALRDPLFEQLPDEARAALLSAHWGESFYLEARMASAAELTPVRTAVLLDDRIAQWSSRLQLALLDLGPAAHGRRVVAQAPAMMSLLAEYTRYGVEDRVAVLNCYLPPTAGHNLLMAAELTLAQLSGGGGSAPTAPGEAMTIADKLDQPASVAFPRDTLEMAVRYLSDEIGAPIVILGGDLQLEGITKNQSFAMDAKNEPARQILLEIVRKANPDKTATGPADARQKLVYVVKPDESGRETVYVTTRAAAARRGDTLPKVFGE